MVRIDCVAQRQRQSSSRGRNFFDSMAVVLEDAMIDIHDDDDDDDSNNFDDDDNVDERSDNNNQMTDNNTIRRSTIEMVIAFSDDDEDDSYLYDEGESVTDNDDEDDDGVPTNNSSNNNNNDDDIDVDVGGSDDDDEEEEEGDDEYSYEDDENPTYDIPSINVWVKDDVQADIHAVVNEVSDVYGENKAVYHNPLLVAKLKYGDHYQGMVYLIFPIVGGSLETKQNLGRVWGFDCDEPIVVRINAFTHFFPLLDDYAHSAPNPLHRKDLGVTVYQGEEPPFPWETSIALRKGGSSSSTSSVHRFCVNCDHLHSSLWGLTKPMAVVAPSVCRRELCMWAFTELGVGRTSTDELAMMAEAVDLLMAITIAAATSKRAKLILSPFPSIRKSEWILDPDKPDYDKALEISKQLPSMQQIISSQDENQLEKICKERGEHVYDLLQWIVSSCNTRIVSLVEGHQIASMGTPYQFMVHGASPEHAETFERLKKENGSSFAFHGSSIENWHSILRVGIKNCSGTKLQMNGAAHGSGVYLSPRADTSLGYSKVCAGTHAPSAAPGAAAGVTNNNPATHSSGNNFISEQQAHIMALCEVVEDQSIKRAGSIWVVPNEQHVIVRFLFVFLPTTPGFATIYDKAINCDTTNPAFADEIRTKIDEIFFSGAY